MISAFVSQTDLATASQIIRRMLLHKDHPMFYLLSAASHVIDVATDAQNEAILEWGCKECKYWNAAWRDIEDLSCARCQTVPL